MLKVFIFSLVLGLLHSLEADHVVAVTALVAKCKNSVNAALTGMLWGIGHALVIIMVTLLIVWAKISIPESLFKHFEFLVGVLLIFLGFRLIKSLRQISLDGNLNFFHQHTHMLSKKPVEDFKTALSSLFIGLVHGLAGSGAIVAVLLADLSFKQSIAAAVAFGLGNIISMGLAALFLGVSLNYYHEGKFSYLQKYFLVLISLISLFLGFSRLYLYVIQPMLY